MTTPTNLQPIADQASPEVPMNENFVTLECISVYGKNPALCNLLTWAYWGGQWGGFVIAAGTLTLSGTGSPTITNYIVVNRATGAISVSTSSANWLDVANYARVYLITTTATAVENVFDHRCGEYGIFNNSRPVSWNSQVNDYTLALTDRENAVAMNKATANTLTVPPNATVAFPVGTSILVGQEGIGPTSIAAGAGVTIRMRNFGSPTVMMAAGQYAILSLVQRSLNEWWLSGDLYS